MCDVTKAIKEQMERMTGIYSPFSIKPVTVAEGENWHPCYDGNKIIVSITMGKDLYHPDVYFVSMTACGADDYFLVGNRNLSGTHKEMMKAYTQLKKDVFDKIPQSVTKQWFFDNGFIEG